MLSNNANIDKKVNNIFMRERANQKYYNCRFINSPIIVDGDFEKSIWRKAEPVEFYIPVTSEKPVSKTEAGLLWDESFIERLFYLSG